jgi:hypothetical protein
MNSRTVALDARLQQDGTVAWLRNPSDAIGSWVCRQAKAFAVSSWLAVPVCGILAVGVTCCSYAFENRLGDGEPFSWFEGVSAWPSIGIILFAAFLSIHFIVKTHFDLRHNETKLTEEFGFKDLIKATTPLVTWPNPPSNLETRPRTEEKIDIVTLWERYLRLGRFQSRALRAVPMAILYMATIFVIAPLIGDFSNPPI